MEYHKDFLGSWYPELTKARGMARAEVLDRYVAKIGKTGDRETAVLRDVTALVLTMDDANLDRLRRHVVPAGWTEKASAGSAVAFTGPDEVTLEVRRGNDTGRILEARFSVQGNPRPHTAVLGEVRLEVDATSARLRFAP
jgi:hypothetical protein